MPEAARRGVRHIVDALPQSARRYAGRSFMALEPGIRDLFLENFAVFRRRCSARFWPTPIGSIAATPTPTRCAASTADRAASSTA